MVAALLPYAQYVIYFTAGFMFLPTGRDVIRPGLPLLPKDKELFDVMNRDPVAAPGSAFMWRVFGVNFVTLSIIKFLTLSGLAAGAPDGTLPPTLVYCFCVYGLVAIGILGFYIPKFKEKKADLIPFFALFALETIAWWAIALS